MISIDFESTGLDLHHAAQPFLLTTCDEDGNQRFWEWDVHHLTREPDIPDGDVEEIIQFLTDQDGYVFHNAKFDLTALAKICPDLVRNWPWDRTADTLIAAHLLASNRPKDLTSLAVMWLGLDIQPYEDRLEEAVKECRRIVKSKAFTAEHGEWLIAKEGLRGNPSIKGSSGRDEEKPWKNDAWLPRAYAKFTNEWPGVTQVISGGQNGVDQAALRAAASLGERTGGTCPKGWRTLDGPAPWLADYGLVESGFADYPSRTYENVGNSDATLQVCEDPFSAGEICTKNATAKLNKRRLEVPPNRDPAFVAEWVKVNQIRVLNVAGNSERTCLGIGKRAEAFLVKVFDLLKPHPWWTVCQSYANADSATTMALWKVFRDEIRRRGLRGSTPVA